MSYVITISADEEFSRSVPLEPLRAFIGQLPGIQPNGEYHFALSDESRLWMEIYVESATEDGGAGDEGSPTVNRVRLHIPYGLLGESPERDYFPTAVAIARHLGWRAIDEQTGRSLTMSRD
jgi:hypothetical protein